MERGQSTRKDGKSALVMKPAIKEKTEPGVPTFAARGKAALFGANPFSQHYQEDRERDLPFTRLLLDTAIPGAVSGPTETNKQGHFLRKEVAAGRSRPRS
jgi:hypothetical protein